MIIHSPKIKLEEDVVCVSSRIECKNKNPDRPNTLWYRFPAAYKNVISGSSDGLVVSLLLLAMSLGEDIQVEGGTSSCLAYNLKKYQCIFNFWCPKEFQLVKITGDRLKINEKSRNQSGVMSSFSGGVDSTYTLWAHLPKNEPNKDYQITHTLFVHGFDIPLADKRTYSIALNSYTQLMNDLKIQLISGSTNLKEFHRGLNWNRTHSSAVVGTALIFDGLISRFYFPENNTYDCPIPHGIHFMTVPLLSTETFESINHDGSISKLDKVKAIAQWPETYNRLRVCWEKPNGLKNCSKCGKCSMTMNVLDMIGALSKYSTFTSPVNRKAIRKLRYPKGQFYFPKTWIAFARSTGRADITFDWSWMLVFSQIKIWRDRIRKIVMHPISIKRVILKIGRFFVN